LFVYAGITFTGAGLYSYICVILHVHGYNIYANHFTGGLDY